MSATELIKQVAALPPEERALFEQLFQAMDKGASTLVSPSEPQWPDFADRLHDIYGDKVTPDSQSVISEGRGER